MLHEAAISRFSFSDALVMEGTVERFMANLSEFMSAKPEEAERREQEIRSQVEQTYSFGPAPSESVKPYVYQDGVAVIPVHGVLINRFNRSWGFVTGYNYIRSMLRAALEDDDVKLIAFDVDSPGGDAPGCFELCEEIRASREVKPSIAVVDALSASGGYAISSSCTRMVCTPSGSVGSVGVYWIHADRSGAHAMAGIKFTIFEAPEGGAKTDGNPYGPMSERASKEAQDRVNKRWDEFVSLVAVNRDMDEQAVRDTQARVYRADEALALTLIDGVSTPSEAVADFLGGLASDETHGDEHETDQEEINMAIPKDQAELDRMLDQARTDARTEAVTADRKRRTEIMALPEAGTRQKLASTLADGDYTAEQAKVLLGAAAEETVSEQQQQQQTNNQQGNGNNGQQGNGQQQQQQTNSQQGQSQFEQAMNQSGGAGIGTNGNGEQQMQHGGGDGKPSAEDQAAAILGDQARFTGHDLREGDKGGR